MLIPTPTPPPSFHCHKIHVSHSRNYKYVFPITLYCYPSFYLEESVRSKSDKRIFIKLRKIHYTSVLQPMRASIGEHIGKRQDNICPNTMQCFICDFSWISLSQGTFTKRTRVPLWPKPTSKKKKKKKLWGFLMSSLKGSDTGLIEFRRSWAVKRAKFPSNSLWKEIVLPRVLNQTVFYSTLGRSIPSFSHIWLLNE